MNQIIILLFIFLSVAQSTQAQFSFQTFHEKDGTEVKDEQKSHFVRIINFPSQKGEPYSVQEYFTKTDSLKLYGAYNDLDRKQYVGDKIELYENGKLKSKEKLAHDGQLIDTAVYYHKDGKLKLAFWYPYQVDKSNKVTVTDTLILIYRDSLGQTLLTNGNGYAELIEDKNIISKGHFKDHKRTDHWSGSFNNGRYTFTEIYNEGKLISGITTDSIGTTYQYDQNNFIIEPEYPGGLERLRQFLADNYRYPTEAITHGVTGTVRIVFTVDEKGYIKDIKVKEEIGHGTGAAAIQTLKSAKKWKPGIIRGVTVPVGFTLPLRLNLTRL